MKPIKKHQQRGLTLISLAFILFVMAMIVMVFLKIFPSYMNNMSIASVLDSVLDEAVNGGERRDARQLREVILTRLDFNNVDNIDPKDILIGVNTETNLFEVSINYEVRKHITGNIDVLLTFENEIEVPR